MGSRSRNAGVLDTDVTRGDERSGEGAAKVERASNVEETE